MRLRVCLRLFTNSCTLRKVSSSINGSWVFLTMICSLSGVSTLVGYGTHFYGIDDLTDYYDDIDAYDYLLEVESTALPKQIIYQRIRMEYLKEMFEALPRRDRDILGKYYGVFGYRKEPLEDIGMYHFLSEGGVRDAKDKALEKLRKAYPTSMMRY